MHHEVALVILIAVFIVRQSPNVILLFLPKEEDKTFHRVLKGSTEIHQVSDIHTGTRGTTLLQGTFSSDQGFQLSLHSISSVFWNKTPAADTMDFTSLAQFCHVYETNLSPLRHAIVGWELRGTQGISYVGPHFCTQVNRVGLNNFWSKLLSC